MRLWKSLAVASLLIALSGCATLRDETEGWSAERFYQEARMALEAGNFETAISHYERLETRHPYGPYTEQGLLELAYAYYKFDEPASAIAAAERFIKLHPRHPNVDYAYYIRGLASFQQGETVLTRMFGQDPSERDPQAAREAFAHFRELVDRFPDSRYVEDATQRMVHLRNNLAKYELHVADYYIRRGAFLAAANRARYVVENYQRTPAVPDALALMIRAYGELGLDDLARDARRVLELNYPDHPQARGAPSPEQQR